MKDFSLLYGPARTWLVIVGTALVAVAIGIFAQGSADAQQTCQATGVSLQAAEDAYAESCAEDLVDCDATADGWLCSSQELGSEGQLQRSSSQDATSADDQTEDEADAVERSRSAEIWADAPQNANDIPFVSLQPSPEEITEAGKELIESNATTTVAPAPRQLAAPVPTNPPNTEQSESSDPDQSPATQAPASDEAADDAENGGDGDNGESGGGTD